MTRTEGKVAEGAASGWVDRSLAEFAHAAAAQGPVPASGCVAAAVGALGAGLASMALGSARGEGSAVRAAAEVHALMEELLACVDRDAEAYALFLEARAGRAELARAVAGSIEVPGRMARGALAALERLSAGVAAVRPHLASEGVTAARALLACVEGATFTARSNLPNLADPAEREAWRAELEALSARAGELARSILDHLRDHAR